MVVLAIVTLGMYVSVWFFTRRKKFGELTPKGKKAEMTFATLIGAHVIYLFVFVGYLGNPVGLEEVLTLTWYCLYGSIIYASVVARSCLAEFAKQAAPQSDYAGSTLWAVILNVFYLQSQVNKMIDARILSAEK